MLQNIFSNQMHSSVVEKKKEKIEVLNSLDLNMMAAIIVFSDKSVSFIPVFSFST